LREEYDADEGIAKWSYEKPVMCRRGREPPGTTERSVGGGLELHYID